jgi:non-canonical purine NTP pyrophosphatase (RdgB/HAM1 family)
MTTRPRLLVASANRGKVAEYGALLEGLDCVLLSLADAGVSGDVEESGSTYEENARIKASTCAVRTGLVTLADDSGLEVDALGGEPGIYSARYACTNWKVCPGRAGQPVSCVLSALGRPMETSPSVAGNVPGS